MSDAPAAADGFRAWLVLAALFAGTFVMGSAKLLAVGVLNLLAGDLRVSDAAAGTLVTAYAIGRRAAAGPGHGAHRAAPGPGGRAGCFIVVTAAAFGAGGFPVLLAARVLTGSVQGLFVGAAFTVATSAAGQAGYVVARAGFASRVRRGGVRAAVRAVRDQARGGVEAVRDRRRVRQRSGLAARSSQREGTVAPCLEQHAGVGSPDDRARPYPAAVLRCRSFRPGRRRDLARRQGPTSTGPASASPGRSGTGWRRPSQGHGFLEVTHVT